MEWWMIVLVVGSYFVVVLLDSWGEIVEEVRRWF